jgi:hypothetical protein
MGAVWICGESCPVDRGTTMAIGVGLILVGLNIARKASGVPMGKFSLGIGILALVIGLAQFAGMKVDMLPLIVILIGLFIVAEAIVRK